MAYAGAKAIIETQLGLELNTLDNYHSIAYCVAILCLKNVIRDLSDENNDIYILAQYELRDITKALITYIGCNAVFVQYNSPRIDIYQCNGRLYNTNIASSSKVMVYVDIDGEIEALSNMIPAYYSATILLNGHQVNVYVKHATDKIIALPNLHDGELMHMYCRGNVISRTRINNKIEREISKLLSLN